MKYQAPFNSGGNPDAGWINGNPSTGTEGSIPSAAAFEQPLRELHALIAKSGITPADADLTQLAQAVRSQSLNYRVAGGTANALTVTLDPAITAPVPGLVLRLIPGATNTGPATLDAGGGALPVEYADGTDVYAGEIAAGRLVELVCDGSRWIVLNPLVYFNRQTPFGARQTRAFTPNVALSDISATGSAYNTAQSITVTGTRYLDLTGYAAFLNTNAQLATITGRFRIYNTLTPGTITAYDYLGVAVNNSLQAPISLRTRVTGLDPSQTYVVQLAVQKGQAIGPTPVLDTLIFALHE